MEADTNRAGSRRTLLGRAFPGIRSRLLVLLLLAGVPLFVLATSIALQKYRAAVERTRQVADQVMTATVARHEEFLNEARRLLGAAFANSPDAQTGPDCDAALSRLMHMLGPPFLALEVSDGNDRVLCRAGDALHAGAPGRDLGQELVLASARRGDTLAVAPMTAGPAAGWPVQWVAVPTGSTTSPARVVLALLLVDWLIPQGTPTAPPVGSVAWATDPTGRPLPLGARPPAAADLPSAESLETLVAMPTTVLLARSSGGPEFAYVGFRLRGGSTLLIGVPAARSLADARMALDRQLGELGLLLVAGLLAMATGAHAWVIAPINRLSQAVGRWRAGGPFEPDLTPGAPAEILTLASVFGQAATALRSHEADLRSAGLRQDLLMQEVHHRVKNNLQIVASLLNLQGSRIRQPEARAEFQAARDRIRALATLHRHLYAQGDLHTINMRGFLEELCAQLLQALGETPEGGRIALTISASELQILPDQAVPVALIVTEAVSNAAKYAFPGGRSGNIRVLLETESAPEQGRPGQVRLTVEDDGVGIPAGRAETESGVRDGIGIQLIRGFARQLGGDLVVEQDGGTQYRLRFRLRAAGEAGNEEAVPATAP